MASFFRAVIRSASEYEAHARHRARVIDKHLHLVLGFSLRQTITFWRGLEDFPIQTGNLQHSVGVNRRIAASRQRLSSLPATGDAISLKDLVHKRAAGYSLLLPIGMEYAPHLEPRLHVDLVIAFARQRLDENLPKGIRNAAAELGMAA